jgi:opacity protein-like surface antigen
LGGTWGLGVPARGSGLGVEVGVRVRLGIEVGRVLVLVLVGVGLERLEAAGRIQVGSEEAGVFHFFEN